MQIEQGKDTMQHKEDHFRMKVVLFSLYFYYLFMLHVSAFLLSTLLHLH